MDELNQILAKARTRKWAQTIRPLPVFLAPSRFSKPRNMKEVETRLELNSLHFLTNYAIVCTTIAVASILSRPLLIILIVLLGFMWSQVLQRPEIRINDQYANSAVALTRQHSLVIRRRRMVLKGKQKMSAASLVTAVVVLIFAGSTIFMIIGLCATRRLTQSVCLNHCLFCALGLQWY